MQFLFLNFIFKIFSWPCHMACRILVPQPGSESAPLALEAWSVSHWTIRKVPPLLSYCFSFRKYHLLRLHSQISLEFHNRWKQVWVPSLLSHCRTLNMLLTLSEPVSSSVKWGQTHLLLRVAELPSYYMFAYIVGDQ